MGIVDRCPTRHLHAVRPVASADNETNGKEGAAFWASRFMANWVFKWRVRLLTSDLDTILWDTLEVSRKVVLEAYDIARHGSGDLLTDTSRLHDEYVL